ncbi:TPA: hypothetical protein HA273_01785 [Candidatus Bathyarchaeota archaeon]|nr:hypothetical protein [Candidatus Bathyarchaeota archaeon]HIJ08853.1 hypothetical protein [Candidatus Bathyarchaeota archaeon]
MSKSHDSSHFLKTYRTLSEVLVDRQLASLGDAYVNFVYSLALSEKKKRPQGAKVKGGPLAEALRKAGLREMLPSRIDKHVLSDAAEAVVVYAWLHELLTLEESVQTIVESENSLDGFERLLRKAKEEIRNSGLFEVPH